MVEKNREKRIDVKKILEILKIDCIICDVYRKKKEKIACKNCPFRLNSITENKRYGKRTRVCPAEFFKSFGIKKPGDIGKHTLFYFLYHPEFNFKLPKDDKGRSYHIHHKNGLYYDDRYENLVLVTNSEHRVLEAELTKNEKEKAKDCFQSIKENWSIN